MRVKMRNIRLNEHAIIVLIEVIKNKITPTGLSHFIKTGENLEVTESDFNFRRRDLGKKRGERGKYGRSYFNKKEGVPEATITKGINNLIENGVYLDKYKVNPKYAPALIEAFKTIPSILEILNEEINIKEDGELFEITHTKIFPKGTIKRIINYPALEEIRDLLEYELNKIKMEKFFD
jgi:hypothetical protein